MHGASALAGVTSIVQACSTEMQYDAFLMFFDLVYCFAELLCHRDMFGLPAV